MEFLKPCLDSVFAQHFDGLEVIVVDNGSVDESVSFIKDNYKDVKLVELKRNLGFAGGNNRGLEAATGEFILTLNNDTVLKEGFFDSLVKSVQSSSDDTGMWAVKILSIDDKSSIDSVGGLLMYPDGLCRGRGRGEKDEGNYDSLSEILFPSACAAIYRKSMLSECGFFDESFFAYCEDSDLGLRCRQAGWKALSVPDAVVYHHYSGTAGKYSPFKAYLVERNRMWLVIKNFSLPSVLMSFYYTFKRYFYQLIAVIKGKGAAGKFTEKSSFFGIILIMLKAYFMTLIFLPFLILKRLKISHIKKVPSAEMKKLLSSHSLSAEDIAFKE